MRSQVGKVVALLAIGLLLPMLARAVDYLPGSGWQELQFRPQGGDLFNIEGPFTFSVTAEMQARLRLADATGNNERFEAYNHGVYMGLWTAQQCCLDLTAGSYSLTFRIQQYLTTSFDVCPDIWLGQFQVETAPESHQCGDGVVNNSPLEECDDGNNLDGDGCSAVCLIEDADADGVPDLSDNCLNDPNPDQDDADSDSIGDLCDPFPFDPDNEQALCDLTLAQCQSNLSQCLATQCPIDLVQCSADLTQAQNDLAQSVADLSQCEADLGQCLADPAFTDTDGDGEEDSTDACPGTASGDEVDDAGCSHEQFCNLVDASAKGGKKLCKRSDWKNDEPVMKSRDRDCAVDKGGSGRGDDRCVAVP